MKVRVCVLAQASPASWVAHYVAAFRACCDTVVVGPMPDEATLAQWDRGKAMHLIQPNDVVCDFKEEQADLQSLLPDGWRPDVVVGIAGIGGEPLYKETEKLTCPTVFLSVDTWQCLLDYREALKYDLVFVAQREFVPHLVATGSRHVSWLPLACDPASHHPVDREPTHDVTFAGSASLPIHTVRRRLIERLATEFSVLGKESVFGEEMCELVSRGRLTFNHCAVQEMNMRIFEAMAMGRPLLTNADAEINGLFDLFKDGKHLIAYRSEEDLGERVCAYLADEDRRHTVAQAGREEVLAKHTYRHRVERILDTLREMVPAPDPDRAARAYHGDRLADYLPTIPGKVVDYGMALGASKALLRRRGATEVIGVATELEQMRRQRASYDDMVPLAGTAIGEADTVAATRPAGLGLPMAELMTRCHKLLRPGGTLVLKLEPGDLETEDLTANPSLLEAWLEAHEFHLRLRGPDLPGGGYVVLARKRTRRLRSIVAEVFTRIQPSGIDLGEVMRRIPPGW